MFKKINYGLQYIDKKDELEVIKSLRNKQITQGEYVEKFEKKFNETVRSKFAIACSSGTAALHLALMSLGLKKNDNVIIPSINFVAAASICKLMGANIYFCDVEKDTFQASKKNILDCIKKYKLKSIKVIFAMHLGGAAINSEEIYKYCVILHNECEPLSIPLSIVSKVIKTKKILLAQEMFQVYFDHREGPRKRQMRQYYNSNRRSIQR